MAAIAEHRVDLEPSPQRVRVRLDGELLAETTRSVVVRETGHAPVVYLPKEDVRTGVLEPTDHQTFCPYKGRASYWSVRSRERVLPNAVWGYEQPIESVAGLAGLVAFYPDRVDWETGE